MNKSLAAAAFLCMSAPCSGEIKFEWREYDLVKERIGNCETVYLDEKTKHALLSTKKSDLEKTITTIAQKYKTEKYADMGKYDFVTSDKCFSVIFVESAMVGYSYNSNSFVFSMFLLKDMTALESAALHEFSHAYDFIKVPAMQKHELPNHLKLIYTETRATKKEYLYYEEIKGRMPKDIYEKLMKCVVHDNYLNAYIVRQPIINEWLMR